MRFQPAAHALALLAAAVILPFQIPRIREHSAWGSGSATVMGNVDEELISTKTSVVRYSYTVNGKRYRGEVAGDVYGRGPQLVTYAKADPSVSSLAPEKIERLYITSCVLAIIGLLPLAAVWSLELLTWLKSRRG